MFEKIQKACHLSTLDRGVPLTYGPPNKPKGERRCMPAMEEARKR
jgi:hypothetical protein